MEVLDFGGASRVVEDDELLTRLRSVRRGADGAFILDHGGCESLWIHINGETAFLCFFPKKDGGHPGFVPNGMWSGERCDVRFQLVGGSESDSIIVPWWQLVPVATAYQAGCEFLHSPSLPASISWFELYRTPADLGGDP